MHCLLTGEHRGVTKSYNRVKHKYHWEKLKSDSVIHTAMFTMPVKKISSSKNQIIHGYHRYMRIVIFDKVTMDIIESSPRIGRSNKYILTLQNQLNFAWEYHYQIKHQKQ